MVVLKHMENKHMAQRAKGIHKIEPRNMGCFLIALGMLNYFLNYFHMFYSSINATNIGFFGTWVQISVFDHKAYGSRRL